MCGFKDEPINLYILECDWGSRELHWGIEKDIWYDACFWGWEGVTRCIINEQCC